MSRSSPVLSAGLNEKDAVIGIITRVSRPLNVLFLMDSKDVLAFPNFDDRSFLVRRSKVAQYNRTMVKIVISTGVKS